MLQNSNGYHPLQSLPHEFYFISKNSLHYVVETMMITMHISHNVDELYNKNYDKNLLFMCKFSSTVDQDATLKNT